jgi:hypothetical protein
MPAAEETGSTLVLDQVRHVARRGRDEGVLQPLPVFVKQPRAQCSFSSGPLTLLPPFARVAPLFISLVSQVEKAFQKQPTVFLGYKKLLNRKGKGLRWVRNVGLGFKTPETAIKVRPGLCRDGMI